jgi:hypothetical protein
MDSKTSVYLRAFLALAALLGFLYLYGRAMVEELALATTPVFSEGYTYVATILAGLIGGVAAMGLGQSAANRMFTRKTFWNGLGRTLAPFQQDNIQNWLAVAYTVVYIIAGIAALLIWISASEAAPAHEMIRNLALIFLGLAIATAQAFFGIQPTPYTARTVATAGNKTGKPAAPKGGKHNHPARK